MSDLERILKHEDYDIVLSGELCKMFFLRGEWIVENKTHTFYRGDSFRKALEVFCFQEDLPLDKSGESGV